MLQGKKYRLAIVGGGVMGTALASLMSKYSSVKDILVIEKHDGVGMENSNSHYNAQTLHEGLNEFNLDLAHVKKLLALSAPLRHYVEHRGVPGLYRQTPHLALAVGAEEVARLRQRFATVGYLYPNARIVEQKEMYTFEPNIMDGRDPSQPIAGLLNPTGYAVDYQKLAQCYLEDTRQANPNADILFDTAILDVARVGDGYRLTTTRGTFDADFVVFDAGSYSLFFAHKLGYGLNYTNLMLSATFFEAPPLVKCKVYPIAQEGQVFAKGHIDPDINNPNVVRLGPSAKPTMVMEKRNLKTFWDFLKIGWFSTAGALALIKLLSDKGLLGVALKNWSYDIPYLGPYLLLPEGRKIIPKLKYSQLVRRPGEGGIRPQLVNLETGKLEMGDATIVGHNVICNPTPSPGATSSIGNARRDSLVVCKALGETFDDERFAREHGLLTAVA